MDCHDVRALLSELVDGELEDATAVAVREHLLLCHACAALERDLRRVVDTAASLGPLEPPSDMWRRIEEKLEAEMGQGSSEAAGAPAAVVARRGGHRPAARIAEAVARGWRGWTAGAVAGAAAAAAVMLLLSGVSPEKTMAGPAGLPEGLVLAGARAEEPPVHDNDSPVDPVLLHEARRELGLAEERFRKAAERLSRLVDRERRERPFSPALAVAYERNLGVIDEAIARCRDLARAAPDDPWAHEVLFAAYQRKLRFLEETLRGRAQEEAGR